MTLAMSRDGTKLKVGRKCFTVHPGQGRGGLALCEANEHFNGRLNFAQIRRMSAAEFPSGLEVVMDADVREYRHMDYLSISRRGERIRFQLSCDYSFQQWKEQVNLLDFFERLMRELKKRRNLKISRSTWAGVDDESFLTLWVTAEFDISGRLDDRYHGLMHTLQSAHNQSLIRQIQSVSTKFLAARSRHVPAVGREHPRAFICHDSRDKSRVVRPIARRLAALMCPVWYDEFSLAVGDRLRESIENGLKQASKCILIISPHFLKNSGWSRTEFDSIFSRELVERKDILLPVWVGVTPREVFEYSPELVNRVGIHWSLGLNEVVRQLYAATSRARGRKRAAPDK